MTQSSHAYFLLSCDEGLPPGMILSGGRLTTSLDFESGLFSTQKVSRNIFTAPFLIFGVLVIPLHFFIYSVPFCSVLFFSFLFCSFLSCSALFSFLFLFYSALFCSLLLTSLFFSYLHCSSLLIISPKITMRLFNGQLSNNFIFEKNFIEDSVVSSSLFNFEQFLVAC